VIRVLGWEDCLQPVTLRTRWLRAFPEWSVIRLGPCGLVRPEVLPGATLLRGIRWIYLRVQFSCYFPRYSLPGEGSAVVFMQMPNLEIDPSKRPSGKLQPHARRRWIAHK
jgi:hypothetical protein